MWRFVMGVAGVLLMVLSVATAAEPKAGQYFQIECVQSGKVLAVEAGDKAEEAKIVQVPLTEEASAEHWTKQQWQFVKVGDYYKIVNRKSGKVLDVHQSSLEEGVQIQQYNYNGGENQQWSLEKRGQHLTIKVRHSGMVLDVAHLSTKNKAAVVQYRYNGGDNQHFRLVQVK